MIRSCTVDDSADVLTRCASTTLATDLRVSTSGLDSEMATGPSCDFGGIPRFCSVFQLIQVISSAKFFLAEEVGLSFNSVMKTPRTLTASLTLHLVDV